MARTPKRLAGPGALTGSAVTKYTSPATGAIVRHLHVSNPSGAPIDFTLSIGADAAGTRLFDGYPVAADSVLERHVYWVLGNAEIIQALGNTLVLTLNGDELS